MTLMHRLGEATRLTRAGQLMDATAAIQAALARERARSSDAGASSCAVVLRDTVGATPILLPFDSGTRTPDAPRPRTDVPSDAFPGDSGPGQFLRGAYSGPEGARDYKLYIPPKPGPSPSLVVMLHGCTQDPDDFAAGTAMNDVAREQQFLVLYPAQSQLANAQRCWNWFEPGHQARGAGEPAILAAMTRDIMSRHAIDPRRVYVAGLSAGGAMAAVLGEAYPELYAAVGVHSGLPAGSAHDMPSAFAAMKGTPSDGLASGGIAQVLRKRLPRSAVHAADVKRPPAAGQVPPTIVFHGDRDLTVHASNGERVAGACCGSNDVSQRFEERRASMQGREVTRRLHHAADGRVVAEHWIVHGAAHAWFGGNTSGSYTDPKGPDATREMVRFFRSHPRQIDC